MYYVAMSKRILKLVSPLGSHFIIVFHAKPNVNIPMGPPAERGVECR